MKTVFALVGLLSFGCVRAPRPRCGTYQIKEHWTIFIWVEEGAPFSRETVLVGCNFWNVVGVTCQLTDSKERADITIYANYGRCEEGERGRTIGRAFPGGRIELFTQCLSPDDETLINISAHEIGHELGVAHTDQEYSSVMSPAIDRIHQCLLEADIEAWNRRVRWRSVLESRPEESHVPWCNLPSEQ